MSYLTDWERKILERFVEAHFSGDPSWADRLTATRVSSRDLSVDSGYVSFMTAAKRNTCGEGRGPYELSATDIDGVPIVFMLFTAKHGAAALEYYRADGEAIKELPSPEMLT